MPPSSPAGRGGEGGSYGACVLGLLGRSSRDGAAGDAAEVVLWLEMAGSGCPWPDRKRFELGVCRRPMIFQCVADPILRNWWLLRLVKAFWRGVHPFPWREVEDEDGPQGFLLMYPFLVFLYFFAFVCCILTTVC